MSCWFVPNQSTSLASFSTTEWEYPAATERILDFLGPRSGARSAICRGASSEAILLWPSWPFMPHPHENILPRVLRASTWANPQDTWSILSPASLSDAINSGAALTFVSPWPSWPSEFAYPKVSNNPWVVTRTAKLFPQATRESLVLTKGIIWGNETRSPSLSEGQR